LRQFWTNGQAVVMTIRMNITSATGRSTMNQDP
jgi:hypothetical protein